MYFEFILVIWTLLAALWWLVSFWQVSKKKPVGGPVSDPLPTLTIFKPLGVITDPDRLEKILQALSSFTKQLDGSCQMLVGIDESTAQQWPDITGRIRLNHPDANIQIIVRETSLANPGHNPKIDWQFHLARHASGELWLWSDADMTAPDAYLSTLRSEFLVKNRSILSSPYVIRQPVENADLLDTFFVNLELFPGVCLFLNKSNPGFALGAGSIFCPKDMVSTVGWNRLQHSLADDYVLGNRMPSSGLSHVVLQTTPSGGGWWKSLCHYFRWQKTIRWCRPAGFAAQIFILPILGWMAGSICLESLHFLAGFAAVLLAEFVWACCMLHQIRCRLRWHHYFFIPCWSLLRPVIWIFCWLPIPVLWGKQLWWTAVKPVTAGSI